MPLSESFLNSSKTKTHEDSLVVKPFRGTLADLLKGRSFDADYYSSYANAKTNPAKIELGKHLFFDKSLSLSGKISCASCHQPDLYFSDGKTKAGNFVHGGSLLRNTPTLYYAAMQSHQFYDLRSTTLEDQADEVMKNENEFNFTSPGIAKKLYKDQKYHALFNNAFGIKNSATGYQLRNALAAFVRSLSPFSSRLDDYFKGNKSSLTTEEITGFNLFMGKAKCGTCHFIRFLMEIFRPGTADPNRRSLACHRLPYGKMLPLIKIPAAIKLTGCRNYYTLLKHPASAMQKKQHHTCTMACINLWMM